MNCTWEEHDLPDDRGWRKVRCTRCGFVTAPTPHEAASVFRDCDRPGMGDYVKHGLAAFGITHERVAWVRGLFGGTGCGGCPETQEALNELGTKVGL